ncbi:hypothetical protein N4R57_08235 [Rhodobacteraceae bacterium D3-12]|nr:hypothetical protein N4R57_08235 [Rhodobacteraceae bacterium D3-12]
MSGALAMALVTRSTSGRLTRISFIAPWMTRLARRWRGASLRRAMEDDLLRLEETAPHLLADVGFVENRQASCAARKVMVAPGHRLELDQIAAQRHATRR